MKGKLRAASDDHFPPLHRPSLSSGCHTSMHSLSIKMWPRLPGPSPFRTRSDHFFEDNVHKIAFWGAITHGLGTGLLGPSPCIAATSLALHLFSYALSKICETPQWIWAYKSNTQSFPHQALVARDSLLARSLSCKLWRLANWAVVSELDSASHPAVVLGDAQVMNDFGLVLLKQTVLQNLIDLRYFLSYINIKSVLRTY